MESSSEFGAAGIWDRFRASALWRALRRVDFLRGSLYLAIELHRAWREPSTCARDQVDRDLAQKRDPWRYETNPVEQERFRRQTAMIDAVRGGSLFQCAAEIGCAEGLYTDVLSPRCASLLVLDISPTALERSSRRRPWPESVRFQEFDLRSDAIRGKFDLIVVAGVLEYFSRRSTLARIREKLAAALAHQGILLVATTRASPVVEDSWWGRHLVRGKWINTFMLQHPSLEIVTQNIDRDFAITLCRKSRGIRATC